MATATRPAPAAPDAVVAVGRPLPPHAGGSRHEGAPHGAERPWWGGAGALSSLLVLGALFPEPVLRDAETGGAMAGVAFVRPLAYTLIAPVSTSLDALALLSVRQHISVVFVGLVAFAVWRARREAPGGGRLRIVLREGAWGLAVLAAVFVVYCAASLAPRPMAALVVHDPDLVRVDFHAHTGASHDGRAGFDAERARSWHRDGGFDLAYVTDHGTYRGVQPGVARNPRRAGDGVVLLSAVEAWSGGEHLNVLGATAADRDFLTHDEQLDEGAIARAVAAGRREPVFIETVPGFLDTLLLGRNGGLPGRAMHRVSAIELSDAAPRGFEQTDSTYERVLRLADSLNLAVVAGSDNHGWGRTAAAWSLVVVPGWRALPPDSLGRLVEARIHAERRAAVRVVERGRPRTIRGAAMLLNAPIAVWHHFASLSLADRIAWLAWAWGLAVAARLVRRRRRAPALRVV